MDTNRIIFYVIVILCLPFLGWYGINRIIRGYRILRQPNRPQPYTLNFFWIANGDTHGFGLMDIIVGLLCVGGSISLFIVIAIELIKLL